MNEFMLEQKKNECENICSYTKCFKTDEEQKKCE